MTFCLRYLGGIETRFNRVERNFDGENVESSKRLSISRRSEQFSKTNSKLVPEYGPK